LQDTEVVTMRVSSGQETESWMIHRDLLTHHSPFFAAALSGSFKESTTNTVELIEDDPGAFALFVQWLYTGKCEVKFDKTPSIACLAWALGDKLHCPTFQDRAICRLIAYNQEYPLREDAMRLIYNVSPPGSRLRMFAVDSVCWDRTKNKKLPQIGAADIMAVEDFNRDLLERLLEYGNEAENLCSYGARYLKVLDYGTCVMGGN
ncbi:MAG: hypothetical protein Q9226_009370, partial [Calogaya cf. arnoldii]